MGDDDRLAEIVGAWRERRDAGEVVDPEEVVHAHPDLADRLRKRFAALAALDEIFAESELAEEVPARLGAYRILRKLGAGGMGTVYLAAAAANPEQHVALKVLHPHLLARPGFFKRFLREAEAGKRVVDENVVRTLDADAVRTERDTAHFLVMEYVEGRTLADLLRELGTVPEALLREIGRHLASGLAAIHREGIVHRDLKPDNVIITPDHKVRIMDLGVARLVEATAALTREGQFAGSLPYAAPEQFGKGEVGPPADLYALGVVLYELATGQNPFRRDEAAAVMRAHLDLAPPPVHETNPDLSPFLSEVLATLLAKEPVDRFPTASALHEVLEAGLRSSWWTERERRVRRTLRRVPSVPVRRETKLYGRETELEILQEAWSRSLEGEGNTLLLEGEAGIGKSRVVDAFLRGLGDENVRVLYGSYPPSGGRGGISDAIVDAFGTAGLADALRPYVTVTPSLVPAFAATIQHERPPEGSASLDGDALQAVFVHLMRGLAAEKPLLWVVEDLHFAPAESRHVVLSLARALEGHPVLLVATTRPALPEDEIAHFSRLENFQRLALGRLSAREVVLLLQDAFQSERLADKLGARIALKSDGVPFFVFEMIRGLKEGQFITELPDGSYVETKEVDRIEVPSAVRDLIEARLRDLSDEDRALLDLAAVEGFEFDPDLVGRVRGVSRMRTYERLAAIERRSGVVRSEGAACRFDHHQIQEVVYEDLMEGLREEYHTSLARAFADREGVAARDHKDLPAEAAHFLSDHHLKGSRPSEALPHLTRALQHLAGLYQNEAAIDLAARALAAPGLLVGKERVDVLLRKAGRHDARGEREAERAALEEALAVADGGEDAALRAKVRNQLGDHLVQLSAYDEAWAVHEEALALSLEVKDKRLAGAARVGLGKVLLGQGRHEEARTQLARSLALSREIGYQHGEAIATAILGIVCVRQGRYEEAREHYVTCLALAREIGNRQVEAETTGNLGNVFSREGRYQEAREHYEQCLAIAREIGQRRGEGHVAANLGVTAWKQGRWEEASTHFERSLALSCEMGDRLAEAVALVNLGPLWLALGHPDRARDALEASLAICREIGARYPEGYALRWLSDLAADGGDSAGALNLAIEALNLRREIGHEDGVADSLIQLGALRYRADDFDAARNALREAVDLSREQERKAPLTEALALLAYLPDGDAQAAESALGEAGESGNTARVRYLLWRATGKAEHLAEAKRLLDHRVEHAPEVYRESMLTNVRLHREIESAWKALHPERAMRVEGEHEEKTEG